MGFSVRSAIKVGWDSKIKVLLMRLMTSTKIQQNQLLNFPQMSYITRFRKLVSRYFVRDCLWKQIYFTTSRHIEFTISAIFSISKAYYAGKTDNHSNGDLTNRNRSAFIKRFCFTSRTNNFLVFSCILKEVVSRKKFSKQPVTKYLETFNILV